MDKQIDWYDIVCRVLTCVILGSALVGGCTSLNKKLGLEDDHPVEEFLEEKIQEHSGIEVDLSGGSPE